MKRVLKKELLKVVQPEEVLVVLLELKEVLKKELLKREGPKKEVL